MLYIPPVYQNDNASQLYQFIQRYGFATVISHSSQLRISHLPLICSSENRFLLGHMAKANPHWHDFTTGCDVVCLFHGPHGYISPRWLTKQPSVPTWNYTVVEARGKACVITSPEELVSIVKTTVAQYEPDLLHPLKASLPDSFLNSLLNYIVGFRIEIQELTGKFKLSQNLPAADQQQLIKHLASQADGDSQQLASFMASYLQSQLP